MHDQLHFSDLAAPALLALQLLPHVAFIALLQDWPNKENESTA
jgi:hypothetical protein